MQGGNIPDILQQSEYRTMSTEECQTYWNEDWIFRDLHICAKDEEDISSICTVRLFMAQTT